MVRFEVFFNFPPKFASKGATGMVVAELMTRAATFWPCYPWVSDPWGSPASCLLLANFGSSLQDSSILTWHHCTAIVLRGQHSSALLAFTYLVLAGSQCEYLYLIGPLSIRHWLR